MAILRSYLWLLLLAGAAIVDFAARILFGFDMRRVIPFEAVLFASVALVLVSMRMRRRAGSTAVRRIEAWVGLLMGLGAVRSAGVAVATANLVALVIGAAGVLGLVAEATITKAGPRRLTNACGGARAGNVSVRPLTQFVRPIGGI